MSKITVFTPTYNRASTLSRVFNSLYNQTYRDFEWILIDDSSTDKTPELIEEFKRKANFPIIHRRFEHNSGKHIAYNRALELATGDLFTVVDSDDEIDADALEYANNKWQSIDEKRKENLSGIYALCRLYDGSAHSSPMKEDELLTNDVELYYKLKLTGDRWWIRRTDVVKQFPFPEDFKGPYYTEGIVWKQIGKKYNILLVNKELYTIHYDGAHSLMRERRPLWLSARYVCLMATDHLNNYFNYFFSYPLLFISQTLYFFVYSFYTKDTGKTWSKLKPALWLWMLLFSPLGIAAHILFFFKRIKDKFTGK